MTFDYRTGEITEPTKAEIPFRVITPDDVRASIKRAKRSLEKAAEEIVWQIEMEAWKTLQYTSWSAFRDAEYGGAAFMVPAKQRPELVARMRAKGLTQQEIAVTAGVTERTVRSDLSTGNVSGSDGTNPITNSRGQQRPASYSRTDDDDVIDAEIVEDDDPTPDATTDPVPAESVITITCPTCHGTGKVTR